MWCVAVVAATVQSPRPAVASDVPQSGSQQPPSDQGISSNVTQGSPQGMGLFLSLRLAWNLGFLISVPAVLFGFGGALMDKSYGTSPIFVITGFVLAAVLSGVGVYRKVKEILGAS